jgi:hypothetical protein
VTIKHIDTPPAPTSDMLEALSESAKDQFGPAIEAACDKVVLDAVDWSDAARRFIEDLAIGGYYVAELPTGDQADR